MEDGEQPRFPATWLRLGWLLLSASLVSAGRPGIVRQKAILPQELRAEVAGQPALASTVARAANGVVMTHIVASPGATWTTDPIQGEQLLAGASADLSVRVHVTNPEGITTDATVKVHVENKGEKLGDESVLWFDNKPENVTRETTLYEAKLMSAKPVRLLYHHTCKASQPMVMRAELRNPSEKTARVLVVPGDARPNREPVLAGIAAARDYLPSWENGSGEVIEIPPHTSQVVAFRRMVLGDVMSGLCSLRLLDEGPDSLDFVAVAEDRREMTRPWELALLSKTPYDEVGPQPLVSNHVPDPRYPSRRYLGPNVTEPIDVVVGSKIVVREIGEEGIPQEGGGRALNGNYGVVYRYEVNARNDTDSDAKVMAFLNVVTPYTGGVFLVDGRLVVLHPLKHGQSARVFQWTVRPRSTRLISVLTVPISGGSYPNYMRFKAVSPPHRSTGPTASTVASGVSSG
jgi:hypothetical protein